MDKHIIAQLPYRCTEVKGASILVTEPPIAHQQGLAIHHEEASLSLYICNYTISVVTNALFSTLPWLLVVPDQRSRSVYFLVLPPHLRVRPLIVPHHDKRSLNKHSAASGDRPGRAVASPSK